MFAWVFLWGDGAGEAKWFPIVIKLLYCKQHKLSLCCFIWKLLGSFKDCWARLRSKRGKHYSFSSQTDSPMDIYWVSTMYQAFIVPFFENFICSITLIAFALKNGFSSKSIQRRWEKEDSGGALENCLDLLVWIHYKSIFPHFKVRALIWS